VDDDDYGFGYGMLGAVLNGLVTVSERNVRGVVERMKLGDDVKFSDGEGADDEEEKDEEEGDKSALGARTQVKAAHESPALVLIGTRTEKRLIHRKSPRRRCARHLFRDDTPSSIRMAAQQGFPIR